MSKSLRKPPDTSDSFSNNGGKSPTSPDDRPTKQKQQRSPAPKMKEKDEETAEIGQRSPKFVNFPPRTDTTGVAASGLQLFLDTEIDNTPTDYWLSVTGHHTRASLPRKFALKHLKSDASRLHIGLLLGTDLIKQIWHIEPKNISIDLYG